MAAFEQEDYLKLVEERLAKLQAATDEYAAAVSELDEALSNALSTIPSLHNRYYRGYFIGLMDSFHLCTVKARALTRGLRQPISCPAEFRTVAEDEADRQDLWAEASRYFEREQRSRLLRVLELLDALERIGRLTWPESSGLDNASHKRTEMYLRRADQACRAAAPRLASRLNDWEVYPIAIQAGETPSADRTRIIRRADGGTDDDYVVERVVEPGYLWCGQVLRKADVIVISQKSKE
jgi:hypothetical protein